MNNWLKILKFTLKQAIKGNKFIASTVITGIIIMIGMAVTNILVSDALDKDAQIKDLQAVYIINETNLSFDTDAFIQKHNKEYPDLSIKELQGISAKDAASNPDTLGENAGRSIVLDITEAKEGCDLTVYLPDISSIQGDDAYDFAKAFSETVKNAKIKSVGVADDKLDMAVSDINIDEIKAEESEETKETSILAYLAPLLVMMVLYFLVLFYGQSIGQIVSSEKTSKLMEYLLTLAKPSAIIFGKVSAIFCEAVMQVAVWIVCGLGGLLISNAFITSLTGEKSKDLISLFMEALPEGGISNNFAVLLILSVIALLAAFLFYCFVSALFASFAATAEDLAQTNGLSVMALLFGFLVSMYVPMFTDNSETGMLIIRLIPFTAAFSLPGDILAARIGLVEFVAYLALLIVFTVLLAVLTGRVYKNRLFKRGTKGIFDEIVAAITGKAAVKNEDEDNASGNKTNTLTADDYANYDNAKKAFTIVGFALLAFMLSSNAIGGIVGSVVANIVAARKHMDFSAVYENTTFLVVHNIIGVYMIAVPLCALIMKLANNSRVTIKGHITKSQYIRAVFIIFPIAVFLGKFSNFLASALTEGEAQNSIGVFLSDTNIPAMIMVSLLAPIFEELVFRKFIIDRTQRYGEMVAIMYSSLAFGLFHCNLYQFFYAFVIGIVLGYVYIRTGNIILTIIMHMCVNASSSILAPLAPTVYEYFIYAMIGLGAVSAIYTLIKRDVKLETGKNEVSSKALSSIAFTNAGTLLFIASCLLLMVFNLFLPMLTK